MPPPPPIYVISNTTFLVEGRNCKDYSYSFSLSSFLAHPPRAFLASLLVFYSSVYHVPTLYSLPMQADERTVHIAKEDNTKKLGPFQFIPLGLASKNLQNPSIFPSFPYSFYSILYSSAYIYVYTYILT